MAKAKTLLETVKSTAPKRGGSKVWIEKLTPAQQDQFKDLIDAIAKQGLRPGVDLPNKGQICQIVKETFGISISRGTLDNYIRGGVWV